MENLQAAAVIIGIVNGFRLAKGDAGTNPKTYWGLAFFVCALVVGIILGALRYFGLTVETGIVTALASSGIYRVGEKVGGQ